MSASVLILISPATHVLCLPICPLYCLHWKLMILALIIMSRHQDSSSAFCYCNWENLLVHGLSHPGGGLCHFLSQLLGLMQVKPLLRLLMMTKNRTAKPGLRMMQSLTLGASVTTISFMVATVHECHGGGGLDGS